MKSIDITMHKKRREFGRIAFAVIGFLIFLGVVFEFINSPEQVNRENVIFEETFDSIKEIVIDNSFNKQVLINPPKRGRIIVRYDKYDFNQGSTIRIEIIER